MGKFWAVLAVGGFIAVLIGLIFHAWKLKSKRDEELGQLAANNNWRYQGKGQVFALEGFTPSGIAWKMEPDDEESVWRAQSRTLTEELLWISPRSNTIVLNYSSKTSRFLLNRLYSKAEAEKIATAKEVEIGSPVFSKRYVVIATDNYLALKVLTDDVERLLTAWPVKEKIKQITLSQKGLEIKVDSTFPTTETVKSTVALGEAITRNVQRLLAQIY